MNTNQSEPEFGDPTERFGQQEAALHDKTCWGCHVSSGDANSVTLAAFLWFADWDERVKFALEVLPAVGADTDDQQMARSLHQVFHRHLSPLSPDISDVAAAQTNLEPVRIALNADLGDHLRVDWWGTAESLLHSGDPFSRAMRSWFRHGADGMLPELAEILEIEPPAVPAEGETLDPAIAERPIDPDEGELFLDAAMKSGT